jgi:hypothetical protein
MAIGFRLLSSEFRMLAAIARGAAKGKAERLIEKRRPAFRRSAFPN